MIEITEEFFKLNNIQINKKKLKLIIINTKKTKKNKRIKLSNKWIYEEDRNKITRFLEIQLNNRLKKL